MGLHRSNSKIHSDLLATQPIICPIICDVHAVKNPPILLIVFGQLRRLLHVETHLKGVRSTAKIHTVSFIASSHILISLSLCLFFIQTDCTSWHIYIYIWSKGQNWKHVKLCRLAHLKKKRSVDFEKLEEIPKFTGVWAFLIFLKYSMCNTFTVWRVN